MRYPDPWGSIRAPGGVVLAPAFVLCSCPDYVNGTKRSRKKAPSTCKRCKGTRFPVSPTEVTKYGTVRCYPTSVPVPIRPAGGTMRISSTTRPTVLPTNDPYDTLRAARFTLPDVDPSSRTKHGTVGRKTKIEHELAPKFNTVGKKLGDKYARKSILTERKFVPFEADKKGGERKLIVAEKKTERKLGERKYGTVGRKSILECDVNPYELMVAEAKEDGITRVSGQRIRVEPASKSLILASASVSENEHEYNRCKSILKKPATFVDTDSSDEKTFPKAKSGSHFYLPANSPRKKVQFLDENCERNNDANNTSNSVKPNKDIGSVSVQSHSYANEVKKSESKIKSEYSSLHISPKRTTTTKTHLISPF